MPELPEVETTRRGLSAVLLGRTVVGVDVREPRLRWPVPGQLGSELTGQEFESIRRRGKYLLFGAGRGTMIVHLGMSGSLRAVADGSQPEKHDHVQWRLNDGVCLRMRDPRRFGAVLWTTGDPLLHPLLVRLGPEPLHREFTGDRLHQESQRRRTYVKALIMDASVVAGLGNIYATEALYLAGIHPARRADRVARDRYLRLGSAIKRVLADAIAAGGTTLRDFADTAGNPGYFRQRLHAYGQDGNACRRCGSIMRRRVIAQRATVYCTRCQR